MKQEQIANCPALEAEHEFHSVIAENPAFEPLAMAVLTRRAVHPEQCEYDVAALILKGARWDDGQLSIDGFTSPEQARDDVRDSIRDRRAFPQVKRVVWREWQRQKLIIADLLEATPPDDPDLAEVWRALRDPISKELRERAERERQRCGPPAPIDISSFRLSDDMKRKMKIEDQKIIERLEQMDVLPFQAEKVQEKWNSLAITVPRPPVGRKWQFRDPATIPARKWVYGKHLMRGAYSVTAAPGAAGKSTLVEVEAIAMASGRNFLGVDVPKPLKVWYINLEEELEEIERRAHAAMIHHRIMNWEIAENFYISGSECELIMAVESRAGIQVAEPVVDAVKDHILEIGYDAVIVDPFAQSHNVPETNEAYKSVAMEWRKIAQQCNCAIELVHHTRKGNGQELSSQDGRGGGALLNHARDGRILNKASEQHKIDMGIDVSKDRATYFTVTSDKPNYSTGHGAQWHRTVGVEIGNGDVVATVERWKKPDAFDGIKTDDVLKVQQAIAALDDPRKDERATNWVGYTIADVLGIGRPDSKTLERARVKRLITSWLETGVLVQADGEKQANGTCPPIVQVGEWITTS